MRKAWFRRTEGLYLFVISEREIRLQVFLPHGEGDTILNSDELPSGHSMSWQFSLILHVVSDLLGYPLAGANLN